MSSPKEVAKSENGDSANTAATSGSQVNLDEVLGAPGSDCLYEKVKVLGSGSFGQAWLVRRKKDGKLLVAKLLDLSQMSAKDQKYVEAEIQCLASCHHFAIVRYEEDFSAHPKMLIVMEFADAGDLNMQIKARSAEGFRYFEEHEVGYTFVQLAMALDHVHRNKMLHRDIKGANVLLMSSGLVKLGDFGFSQQYEDTVSGAVAGTFCGTPYYLAPELWKRQRYSKKADIWSLGILLYEMMALKRPFNGNGMKPLMDSVLKGQAPPLPQHFSQDLRDLCTAMLTPDPNQRPSIASLFQRPYLQKLLNDFEKSAAASTLIDAQTKALIKDNIQEARDMKPDDKNAGNAAAAGAVGSINKEVTYEGPIRKESNRVWKERYFMLKDGELIIAVKKGDALTKGISVGTLASVVPVPFHAAKAEGVFALNTLDNKTMWMQAPSKAECQTWIHRIQQAMGIA
jgi:serine/threonine protein kinase